MMFEAEYVLISCVCLYINLDSKCHELESKLQNLMEFISFI